ncbi:mini-chromosome maintenance complex-binding protein [Anopheles bellator]|uniref:mini-chromosome maintenance complex-binding protein n=1 Tax=Anopheles bellator TaxID=139047 RepID=UPI0026470AFE|nr:mini-chromosome maintenance complex-binding protein [Anopheles bellator]
MVGASGNETWSPEEFVQNESAYLERLADESFWRSIPLLNCTELHHLSDGCLVRFRGLVQDQKGSEYCLGSYNVHCKTTGSVLRRQNGKFRDILVYNSATERVEQGFTEAATLFERRSIVVVSVPGQNRWALEYEQQTNGAGTASTTRDSSAGSLKDTVVEGSEPRAAVKRALETDMEVDADQPCATGPVASNATKRVATDHSAPPPPSGTTVLSADYLLNSPISDRPSKACLVKVYSNFDDWTVNSVIEAVGFLSVHPALDGSVHVTEDPAFDDELPEHQANNPPPSLIPRLHAVSIRKLSHINPILLAQGPGVEETLDIDGTLHMKDLHNLLTQCLFGDRIAADYLLCHLVSSVYIRDEVESRGQFSLNLSNIPGEVLPGYTESLYGLLELLLPASHYFPMTLESMNTVQFAPKKDYDTNTLTSGLLQLAPHTHLVLDETRLKAGKLEAAGVEAVQHVARLIKNQRLKYNFQFYQLEFNTDVPVLILSEGRSMLPSNCQLPIIPDLDAIKLIDETIKAGRHYVTPKLGDIRCYLSAARIRSFDMKTLDPAIVEEDFVRMRTANSDVSMDDLHNLVVLARLLGISAGKRSLEREHWERAKELERERHNRLEMFVKRKNEP